MLSFDSKEQPIAIIGAGCRLPGSSNRPSKLWELLETPLDVAVEIPADRFSSDAFYHPDGTRAGCTNVKESYFITDRNIRCFDAAFFSTKPSEAEAIDPQHRHLLEVVYEALEDAGLSITDLKGSNTAVFVGQMCNDYSVVSNRDFDHIPKYSAPGVAPSNASSRVAYAFDWHGPALTVDTACSSSLVALDQAVQILRSGKSDVAVAAGTNLILDPVAYVTESKIGMLSPTGRSRMWDADADGYARGEGVAAVILKTLSAAIRDGDAIESVIRGIGLNHDGRTNGITMPSGIAQAALIRDTYAKAGLNLALSSDRCQYFEAHGTGTPAGDPQEASALHNAFFSSGTHGPDEILHVGSIKTVVGHTEGTAGLAGILKATLALKHGVIPPNLLFNRLSPSVEPYYNHLRILKESIPWPVLPEGVPRRASINSFGFGGSNAHAILESYDPREPSRVDSEPQMSLVPFVFSANSETSLISMVSEYMAHLEKNKDVPLTRLRHTLSCRRSDFPHKIAFAASDAEELISKMRHKLENHHSDEAASSFGLRSESQSSILGVFTGQGAQWPTMGSTLIVEYPAARQLFDELDASLQTIPAPDRPSWRILDELSKDKTSSRIAEAAISQPLCTAVQLVLVDLLHAAGIKFKAVVGHSSGEIAAAYAAGFISSSDAIRIAYYRGLHAKLARGPGGCKGAMMAVGTSLEDAKELCGFEEFEGRLCVAASNSPTSVTLSGDVDAVEEAQEVLEQESKFTRILKVDTAYHSHHMNHCAEGFQESLRACNITLLQPNGEKPAWISSVRAGTKMEASDNSIKCSYWADNMTGTVLFREALEFTVESLGKFNAALELGPHPALKGPATETLKGSGVEDIAYMGTLNRGVDDVLAVSGCLGSIWMHLGGSVVKWSKFIQEFCHQQRPIPPVKNLPLYPWDHGREFWAESRLGRQFRIQQEEVHELLGRRMPYGMREEVRWKNVLNIHTSPWLSGHAVQGQTVYPAAAYIGLAMEAAIQIARDRDSPVQSIEVRDFLIGKAIAIDDNSGTDIIVTMSSIAQPGTDKLCAQFTCHSAASRESEEMVVNASGAVEIVLGTKQPKYARDIERIAMSETNIEEFYDALSGAGYHYSGPFKALSSLCRRLGTASGTIKNSTLPGSIQSLFHPAVLDNAFHGAFAAMRTPGDDGWSLRVPYRIRYITLIPGLCGSSLPEHVEFDSRVVSTPPSPVSVDIDIIGADGINKCIEVEGLELVPFAPPTEADDKVIYIEPKWDFESPNGTVALGGRRATSEEKSRYLNMERLGFYYLKNLVDTVSEEERAALQIPEHHEAFFAYASHVVNMTAQGGFQGTEPSWLHDTAEDIAQMMKRSQDCIDFVILSAVGEKLPAIIRNETTILEVITKDNMLDDFYENSVIFKLGYLTLSNLVRQITTRYPHMNVLEVGAGTGGATRHIIDAPHASFTYTDVSSGFFEKAQAEFSGRNNMTFKTLNMEMSPKDQGFDEHSYDMIVAANVLHATPNIEQALLNVRSLLKPGGYLALMEVVYPDSIPTGVIMGCFPGWWTGIHDGRKYSPTITMPQWNNLLRKTGFGGIDAYPPLLDPAPFHTLGFVAQAVDDTVNLYRRPLTSQYDQISFDNLVVLGGEGIESSNLACDLLDLLRPRCKNISHAISLEQLDDSILTPLSTVVSLLDLDRPALQNLTSRRWQKLLRLFNASGCLLWVAHGSMNDQPDAGAMTGLLRCFKYEQKHIRAQFLEVEDVKALRCELLANLVLRLRLGEQKVGAGTESGGDMLWTHEPEMLLQNGELQIVRYYPAEEANTRYNSAGRNITKAVDPNSTCVRLHWDGSNHSLRQVMVTYDTATSLGLCNIQVDASILYPIRIPRGFAYLCLGIDIQAGTTVLALSDQCASTIAVPKAHTVSAALGTLTKADFLELAATYLVCQQILRLARTGASLLIHEPSPLIVALLILEEEPQVFFSTSGSDVKQDNWIFFKDDMSRKAISRLFPKPIDIFLDLSCGSSLGQNIGEILSDTLQYSWSPSLVSMQPANSTAQELHEIPKLLLGINRFIAENPSLADTTKSLPTHCQTLKSMIDKTPDHPLTVIQWTQDHDALVTVEPVDSSENLLQAKKTYWMFGLAGDLGQSLCDWMVKHGARYIILSSRTPKAPEGWLAAHKAKGVTIELVPGDITDIEFIRRARQDIESRLPPIAGVANGALILHDKFLLETELQTFESITKPKTIGTENLDKVFYDDPLDWFMAFSSAGTVAGYAGQSGYAAANWYMNAVVHRRRKRGLAASSIHIAQVRGVGYVEREAKGGRLTSQMVEKLNEVAQPLSESDLHQLFAEGIVSGRRLSDYQAEMCSAVRHLTSDTAHKAFWSGDARFCHLISPVNTVAGQNKGNKVAVPVSTLISMASTTKEVARIIRDAFTARMNVILQQPADHKIPDTLPLIDLGVDSLIAVDVRSWFLQELGVEVAVLQLLGGATLPSLVDEVVEKLPLELLSKVQSAEPSPDPAQKSPEDLEKLNSDSEEDKSQSWSFMEDPSATGSSSQPSLISEPENSEASSEKIETAENKLNLLAKPVFEPELIKTIPMSHGQAQFWFLRQLFDNSLASNVSLYFRIVGRLDSDKLSHALEAVCQRHDTMRTCFFFENQEARQGIMRKSAIRLENRHVSKAEELEEILDEVRNHEFDIERGNILRVLLCEESPNLSYLVLAWNHIALDGFSVDILLSELVGHYQGLPLPSVTLQYPDWALKQLEGIEGHGFDGSRDFWKKEFAVIPPILPLLPMAQSSIRTPLDVYRIHRVSTQLRPELVTQVKNISRKSGASVFHFHLATFGSLLARLTASTDLCIGMADANRMDPANTGIVGLLLNIVPIRFGPLTNPRFTELLRETRNKVYSALSHGHVPFDVMLKDIGVPRGRGHHPLFQAFIDYQFAQKLEVDDAYGEIPSDFRSYTKTSYDVSLNIFEDLDGNFSINIGLQAQLYSKEASELLLRSYLTFLEEFSQDPSATIDRPHLYSSEDVQESAEFGLGELVDSSWPESPTICHRIDAMAGLYPNSVALKERLGHSLSYTAMSHEIQKLQIALAEAGVERGGTVAVFQQPSADWICSMLAVMRLGATYLPLDSNQGLPRLSQIVKAASPAAILVDKSTAADASTFGLQLIINTESLEFNPGHARVPNMAKPSDAAAVLFTSGSTGTPKGIVLRHSAILNAVEGMTKRLELGREKVLQHTAYNFDMSLNEILMALCNGGTLVLADRAIRGDSRALMEVIMAEGISYTKATPAQYSSWIQNGAHHVKRNRSWKYMVGGGDRMTDALRREVHSLQLPHLRLFNTYGPAEATLSQTMAEVSYTGEEETYELIPVGKPLSNYAIYVVDESLKLLPPGVAGEIVIGGAGTGIGYLNDVPSTNTSFLHNPWSGPDLARRGWTKMYRTGDRGYFNKLGELVFIGRISGDTQVKLRGIRVELGDIERSILSESDGALETVVCVVPDESDFIVAHGLMSTDFASKTSTDERSAFLDRLLKKLPIPQYMRPALIVPLSSFPLTDNRKIDRRAIAAMPIPQMLPAKESEGDFEVSELESILATLWLKVLHHHPSSVSLSRSSEFFRLGGNSLSMVSLQGLIRETFATTVPLPVLLGNSTLSEMAAKIEELQLSATIDWDLETAPPNINSVIKVAPGRASRTTREVVLTGATGHLGKRILQSLLESPDIDQIHCVAVRDPRKLSAYTLSPKVTIYQGDLTDPNLGLDQTASTHLASTISAIIHTAADRKFFTSYAALMNQNVRSMRELIRLAAARRVPVHFMSSAGIFPDGTNPALGSAVEHIPDVSVGDGYMASKWAGERMLERAGKELGVPAYIYRTVAADNSAQTDDLSEKVIGDMVNASLRAMTLPDASDLEDGWVDLVSIEEVVGSVLKHAMQQVSLTAEEAETCYVHFSASHRLTANDLERLLARTELREHQDELKFVPLLKWLGSLKKVGLSWMVGGGKSMHNGKTRHRR